MLRGLEKSGEGILDEDCDIEEEEYKREFEYEQGAGEVEYISDAVESNEEDDDLSDLEDWLGDASADKKMQVKMTVMEAKMKRRKRKLRRQCLSSRGKDLLARNHQSPSRRSPRIGRSATSYTRWRRSLFRGKCLLCDLPVSRSVGG